MMKAAITPSFRAVEAIWKALPCRSPLRWIDETRRIDPSPSSIGETPGRKDLAYSPSAIAARATGAEKPTVAESQPARKPIAGP